MNDKNRAADAAFLRGLTQRRIGRRDLLRISGLSAATVAFAAACGVKGAGTPGPTGTDAVKAYWADKTKHGTVNFANWPLYMDTEKKPELTKFTQETGITVNYSEAIQDDPSWFAAVQPQLAAGQSIGYDLQVITNGWEFTEFKTLGYLAPLDHSKLTNFIANADPVYTHSSYDPGNVYSVPWASGMTGIAFDPDKTGPITKLADLWNPKFSGKIGMMSDPSELANFGLLVNGVDPQKSTPKDWQAAADKLMQQKSLVRKYYDQGYAQALTDGEIWITQAWSGDIYQLNASGGSNFQFVIPDEGGTLWTDNMTIPITAQNPVDALMLLDFFYRPDIAASLAEYINYVTPVPGAKAIIKQDADKADNADDKATLQALVDSPLVFPDEPTLAKLHRYVDFATSAQHQQFTSIFEPVTLS